MMTNHHHPSGRTAGSRRLLGATATAAALLVAGGCSVLGSGDGGSSNDPATDGGSATDSGGELTVVTHDSFNLSEGLIASFEEATGYRVTQVAPGDGGALVNQLILTADNPLGDVVYGIDNSFAARALDAGVLAPYEPAGAPAEGYEGALTAIDFGDVCINIDHEWFADHGIEEPATLEDLTDPQYADLLVVTNPATSSPGLSFLLATVGAFGDDGWQQYWQDLTANGVRVTEGWSDAYYVDFSGSEGAGPRPLVLSYSSSPAAEEPGRTGALLDTCFRQTEYAGVLAGAQNPEGAEAFIDFLLSPEVQEDIPGQMYMYPADPDATLPVEWAEHAPVSENPHGVDPADIAAGRDEWIRTWTEIVIG
ncbi:thiamine ABC transporter substrate-binding protein [Georgenia sp. MJ170]|uniref:thiamine ABC transporter substrate-binding protein n=1 Tax=Georgenia sunbinii TaxID=3117728 RepID=UPI002F266754